MSASKQSAKNRDQFTDLGAILSRYLYHWPLFLTILILTFSAAFVYLKLTPPEYEISASILVNDEKKVPQEKSTVEELDKSSPKNAEAEIQIIRSKKLVKQVVEDLGLAVNYSEDKGTSTRDLYDTAPFKLLLTKKGVEEKQDFEISIKDKNTFEVIDGDKPAINGKFGQILQTSVGRWTLKPTDYLDQYVGQTIDVSVNDPEKVANDYIKAIDVRLLDKAAPTIGLFLNDKVPQRGKDILNYLIKSYNEASSEEEKRTTKSTIDFIDNRLASLTKELNSAESQVEGYRSSQGLTDINSQSKVYLENVQTNDIKLNEVNVQLNVINGIERYVNSTGAGQAPATIGISDPALDNLIEKLSELQLKKSALLATTPESNPAFEPLNDQISTTKSAIKSTISGIKSSLLNQKSQLQSFNNQFESSIKDIPVQERQFVGLKRQQSIKENLYVYLLQKREELALSYASTLIDARIVDKANVGEITWPRPIMIFAAALFFGLAIPFFIIYFRQSFNNKITDKKEIENALDVPLLGELSYEDVDKEIVVLDNNRGVVSEQFRTLRTSLHYLHDNKQGVGRVTLFTSSTSGEGKSFVSSNLAASLAATGRKTVILEMDLRKPRISKIFNKSYESVGISDFLASDINIEQIIQSTGLNENLDFIPSGHIPPNPSELLEKDRLGELITLLKQRYDDVIIDSPPLHLVTDAMIIARHTDLSLYIIRQGQTAKAELEFINDVHENEKIGKMSIIFNGIQKAKYGYGYSYDNSYYTAAAKPTFNVSWKLFLSRF